MKKNHQVLFLLLTVLLTFTMACSLLEQLLPTQAPAPTEVPTETMPAPTATEEPTATIEPTETPPNHGQILYTGGGNIWRYLVDDGTITQLTFDGSADSYETGYHNPLLSADGRYASYTKNETSYLHKLEDNSVTNLSFRIFQWSQTRPASFYAGSGTFTCPAVDNLEEQTEINFDLLRYDVDNLESPTLIANIVGGLKYPQSISEDEQYASILYCACYSECGSYVVHHLPSNTPMAAPADLSPGKIDFSLNSSRFVTSQLQMYGYAESSLYLANSDFSGAVVLYDLPNVGVVNPQFSPDGGWIGFTAYDISGEFELADKRALIINLDGSVQLEIADSYAEFTQWAPDGSQVLFGRGAAGVFTLSVYDLLSGMSTELPIAASSRQITWGVLP